MTGPGSDGKPVCLPHSERGGESQKQGWNRGKRKEPCPGEWFYSKCNGKTVGGLKSSKLICIFKELWPEKPVRTSLQRSSITMVV